MLGDTTTPPPKARELQGGVGNPPRTPLTFPTAVELVLVGGLCVLQEQADGMGQLGGGQGSLRPLPKCPPTPMPWGN